MFFTKFITFYKSCYYFDISLSLRCKQNTRGFCKLPGVVLVFRDQSQMCNEVRVILRQDPGHTSSPGALHQTTTHPFAVIQLRGIIFSHCPFPFKYFLIVEIVTPKTYQVNRYLNCGLYLISYQKKYDLPGQLQSHIQPMKYASPCSGCIQLLHLRCISCCHKEDTFPLHPKVKDSA